MAYMRRGNIPSVRQNNSDNGGRVDNYRESTMYRNFYYVPLDNTYVAMQIVCTILILIVGIVTFLASYKSSIVDPIENIKNTYINSYLIVLLIFAVITFIVHLCSKNLKDLMKRLIITFIISIITLMIFTGIKLNYDGKYTKNSFEQFYEQTDKQKNKIDIGLTGVNIKTEKEYYLDECVKLYDIFKIKSWGIIGLHGALNLLLIYQIIKLNKMQSKKETINKDDLILFDDEENVKY